MEILLGILASGGFFSFITFLITRKDKEKTIEKKLNDCELGVARTQMMLLIKLYPNNIEEIMRLAEYYFKDLNGDFYMTSLFSKWLKNNDICQPLWFNENK